MHSSSDYFSHPYLSWLFYLLLGWFDLSSEVALLKNKTMNQVKIGFI